jgi:hypothetical protein
VGHAYPPTFFMHMQRDQRTASFVTSDVAALNETGGEGGGVSGWVSVEVTSWVFCECGSDWVGEVEEASEGERLMNWVRPSESK